MFSQDLVRYNPCKFVDPNTLSNYDIADHSYVPGYFTEYSVTYIQSDSKVYVNSRNQGQYSLVSSQKYSSYFFLRPCVSQLVRASLLPYYSLRNVYLCLNTFDFV